MNKIEKLLRKISKEDRAELLELIERLMKNDANLKFIKIVNSDLYRLRHKNFRIIFHKESGEVVIDGIRMRNENTYKNL